MANILLVDDDPETLKSCGLYLKSRGHNIACAKNGHEGFRIFQSGPFDLIVSDLVMEGMDGINLLEKVKESDPHVGFIIFTAFPSVSSAVRSLKSLADDYVEKPLLNIDDLHAVVKVVLKKVQARMGRENEDHAGTPLDGKLVADGYMEPEEFMGFLGKSPRMKEVYRCLKKIAPTDSTVLITGETGTGKELAAKTIHELSPRKKRPFVAVNCAAIPVSIFESELFGHEKGAFTSADKTRTGLFEEAEGGTLFLDEIGEISPETQVKLLRVIQEREVRRVGDSHPININVRIIASSNKDLLEEIHRKNFRKDLYYRLNVMSIHLPPLREREGDIRLLMQQFLSRFGVKFHGKGIDMAVAAWKSALAYPWPGNVRELINVLERAVLLADGRAVTSLPLCAPVDTNAARWSTFKEAKQHWLERFEREFILDKVRENGGNIAATAKAIGLDVKSVWRKVKIYGILA
ncbi:MAG: sigma-54-dependent Fis family transcriptional regulator [Nitrospinae bacterium]|nr:sigma-54-dependent Fis family transcriptional regulator [Nitrospinota bacterium]